MIRDNDTREYKYLPTDEKIALRNSWLKIGVIGSFTAVLVVKIWQADFNQVFSGFDFSDLLSLFLAIFAISLAVLFYLKATDTANVFYNNTYRFTQDVSEILGRIEAGFGERLRHLDEGYSGLISKVENLPFDREKAEEEIKEEEEQVKRVVQEKNKIIEELAERAKLEEKEKRNFFKRLEEQDKELSDARLELNLLKRQLHEAEIVDDDLVRRIPPHIRQMLEDTVLSHIGNEILHGAPTSFINRKINALHKNLPARFVRDLNKYGIIDSDSNITGMGIELLRRISREEL